MRGKLGNQAGGIKLTSQIWLKKTFSRTWLTLFFHEITAYGLAFMERSAKFLYIIGWI